jgi:cytochrome c peroxidase
MLTTYPRRSRTSLVTALAAVAFSLLTTLVAAAEGSAGKTDPQDRALIDALRRAGFTGRIEQTLETRLGRRVDTKLANIGRMLWFDPILALNDDNACAGCHSPSNGFGDTQSIAIGIDNNGIVGPNRAGPRNMRRTPMAINTAFYPRQMWNSRFAAGSGDPFDNRAGLLLPEPEGATLSHLPHLLTAQAFVPPVERTEMTGLAFSGDNNAIRAEVARRLNAARGYRDLFGRVYPEVKAGAPIAYEHAAAALAEFEFALTFANAPIDRYARGDRHALSDAQKRGALLFFGDAGCVACHRVDGASNEMFSDFSDHVAAVPQIVPERTNAVFDGPGADEDFGREQFTGDPADRYKFRTAPLRNAALQPAFFHNGAFTSLAAAIRYHADTLNQAAAYTPESQQLPADLRRPTGPLAPMLARLDPLLAGTPRLTQQQLDDLTAFVGEALLDERARPEKLKKLIPKRLPSGRMPLRFELTAIEAAATTDDGAEITR